MTHKEWGKNKDSYFRQKLIFLFDFQVTCIEDLYVLSDCKMMDENNHFTVEERTKIVEISIIVGISIVYLSCINIFCNKVTDP